MMNSENDKLKLQSLSDIMGMNFYIPTYQRGYRWKARQVIDLLDDLWEFYLKEKKPNEIYCLQPLVVKRKEEDTFRKIKEEAANLSEIASLLKGYWEVIDGQQRLTTFYIILAYLCPELPHKFRLEYATRNPDDRSPEYGSIGSKEFLKLLDQNEINEEVANSNIDFYHMRNTYDVVLEWVRSKKFKEANEAYNLEGFIDTLMHRVKFIWYETDEPDPIAVFIRLNIGKISLTDSELIKALFLNESNFPDSADGIRLQQIEIATEWDQIEKTLRGDEFWLFIHDLKWDKPTRIEWIFDMIVERQLFGEIPDCGDDNHKTFRYFYEYFNRNKECINAEWIRATWNKVKNYFMIFQEWYNDFELYHYIGYLVHLGTPVEQIIKRYENSSGKTDFKRFLKSEIRKKISACSDLLQDYGENGESKRKCFNLLLLLNIQTVINQNIEYIKEKKYGIGAYYRFPFHLFKKEGKKANKKGWEVEHIASNSGDDLTDSLNRNIWLASVLYSMKDQHKDLGIEIEHFIDSDNQSDDEFKLLQRKIKGLNIHPLDDKLRQRVWNFTLLDSATNEEYQNDPFPIKRICVLSKDAGRKAIKVYDKKTRRVSFNKDEEVIAFVPPTTKDVFIKAYTDMPESLTSWTEEDAKCYLRKIEEVLCEFLYPEIYNLNSEYRKVFFKKKRIIAEIPVEVRNRYIRLVNTKISLDESNKPQ